jgi:hypothetical protein
MVLIRCQGGEHVRISRQGMTLPFDDHLPKWDYRAIPPTEWNLEVIRDQILTYRQGYAEAVGSLV